MLIPSGGKKFKNPDAGLFLGTIIDVIYLGLVPSKNPKFPDPQVRIRIVWVLDKNDSEGKPFRIIEQPTFKMSDGGGGSKKSRLYEIFEGVFQGAIPVPHDSENLIGRSNLLFLEKNGEFVNIKGFMPVPAGKTAPVAPMGFVRDKDDPKAQAKRAERLAAQKAAPAVATAQAAPAVAVVDDQDIPF